MNVVDPPGGGLLVAYFCSEFGVDERLPIYAGGLGVLAGDHLKSSSDLEVPLVGMGLFYRGGYFRQSLDETGWQCEAYPDNDPESLGLERLPVEVSVDLAGEQVAAAVGGWASGACRYLLDSDLSQNSPEGRAVTATLYGGDREQRIRQEILLGVGGVRALAALGVEPTVFHMNEGHAALLTLERVRRLVEDGVPRAEAFERVRSTTVFTTHTPVAAGHDVFDLDLAERYLGPLAAGLRMSFRELAALGSANGGGSAFGMTPLALRTSAYVNGVSSLHGEVSRRMWKPLWPELGEDEVPITHITNGVHPGTWLSPAIAELLPEGRLDRAGEIDPEDSASSRCPQGRAARARRVGERDPIGPRRADGRVRAQVRDVQARRPAFLRTGSARLACSPILSRPVQIVLAGKAHPADHAGRSCCDGSPRLHGARNRRPGRVPRGLRHRACARARPRDRRVVEHAASVRSRPPGRAG